jgi:hypothetical protein
MKNKIGSWRKKMSKEPKFDPVMIDLEKHLLKQEEDYIDPRERAQEIRERAADDACSTWEEKLPNA